MSAVANDVAAPAAVPKQTTMQALKPAATDQMPEVAVGFGSMQAFALLQRVATMFSQSPIVPDTFRGNVGSCAIAVEMAARMSASPLAVMQNMDVIYGRPSWRAKFLIACFNHCGRFEAISYEWIGEKGKDSYGCVARSRELRTGKEIRGPEITWKMVKAEGWDSKKGSKWLTIPDLMFMYRAGAWLVNTTAPEISMGLLTDDEVRDTYDAQRGADGSYQVTTESLRQTLAAAASLPPHDSETGEVQPIELPAGLELIKKADTVGALESVKSQLIQNAKDTKRDFPVEWEGAINDRLEKINQLL